MERKKKRTEEEQKKLINRLKLVEGQIRGIQNMVESDAYCPDILIQVSAVTAAGLFAALSPQANAEKASASSRTADDMRLAMFFISAILV